MGKETGLSLPIVRRSRRVGDRARSMHPGPKTVSDHQSLIKDKLGVCNTAAMAQLAIYDGLIQPQAG
jgi:two-component system invasion response regulator UvrY